MKKDLILLCLLLTAMIPLGAGNSIFSYDGYPVQFYGKDIYSLGMGDTGASDVFRFNTGYANPAVSNLTNRTIFATGMMMGYNAYRSLDSLGVKHHFVDNSFDLPYFTLSLPLKIHRLGFQFNSLASGVVSNQRSFMIADSVEVIEKQEMDRYLYRADLIYSLTLGKNSLGVSGNFYFGHEVHTFIQEADFGLFNTKEELARTYKNPSLTLGYLRHEDKYAFGFYYSMGRRLSGEEIRTSIHEEEDPVDYSFSIPAQIAGSVTILPKPEFKVASDFQFEPWRDIDANKYINSWKLALGVAYEPNRDEQKSVYLRFPLRTGISYRRLPFKANDNIVDELALSLGFTFPLKGDVNRIDLGFQYSNRGNLELNKLGDNSFMLMFGFVGFDILTKAPDRRAPRDIPVMEETD